MPSQVTWTQLDEPLPADLKQACADLLASLDTTLAYDIQTLEEAEKEKDLARGGEDRVLALRYRVAKKQLLAAAAGSTGSPVCMCVRCVGVWHARIVPKP